MPDPAKRALLFPGQGSQEPGMGARVASVSPHLHALASELVGEDPFERANDGTRFAQPAIHCASLAAWEEAGRPGAHVIAGHSLGELAALVAGGALEPEDGVRLAVKRGELMQRAADAAGGGAMLALLGNDAVARELAAARPVTVANDNAPGQIVLSGDRSELDSLRRDARDAGLRALRLPVAGAFHSPAMQPAAEGFARALREASFRAPRTPVLSCATAREFEDPAGELAAALTRPVRWRETMAELHRRGIDEFTELGPGRVLTGLVERNPAPEAARG